MYPLSDGSSSHCHWEWTLPSYGSFLTNEMSFSELHLSSLAAPPLYHCLQLLHEGFFCILHDQNSFSSVCWDSTKPSAHSSWGGLLWILGGLQDECPCVKAVLLWTTAFTEMLLWLLPEIVGLQFHQFFPLPVKYSNRWTTTPMNDGSIFMLNCWTGVLFMKVCALSSPNVLLLLTQALYFNLFSPHESFLKWIRPTRCSFENCWILCLGHRTGFILMALPRRPYL